MNDKNAFESSQLSVETGFISIGPTNQANNIVVMEKCSKTGRTSMNRDL